MIRQSHTRCSLAQAKRSLNYSRKIKRLADGIVTDMLKFKLLGLLERIFSKPQSYVENQSKFKELTKRMFHLVTVGTKDSIAEAILISKAPSVFTLLLSGAGAISFVLLTTLLRKLYKVVSGKQ